MALLIIGVLLCALAFAGYIYHFVIFTKSRDLISFNKPTLIKFGSCLALFSISCVLTAIGICIFNKYNLNSGHWALTIIGSLCFGVSFFTLLFTFTNYYYKLQLPIKIRKLIRKIFYISIVATILFLIMSIEGYAPYMTTPYTIGIEFSSRGVHIVRSRTDGFFIAWYGIIILCGAVIAYFAADHEFYKEYKKHGLIDTLFILSFIMGIIGARFWYCFVLEKKPETFFQFSNGGLAIMGGVLFGTITVIVFILVFRRYINVRHALDLIAPCLLIAQGIGRWGNFFNQEVYGYMTFDPNTVWWLPVFIKQQMTIGGLVHLPLFLIEFISNLAGYFIIRYAIGQGLKKHLSFGDLVFIYISWYGLTRVILEPLRQSTFEYNASYITAWIMFGGGLGGVLGCHLYDYIRWGKYTFNIKKNDPNINEKFKKLKNPYLKKTITINE